MTVKASACTLLDTVCDALLSRDREYFNRLQLTVKLLLIDCYVTFIEFEKLKGILKDF